jgi:hypothetical protein
MPLKTCKEKKAIRDDMPVDSLKELGDSGLKIMTALVKKIYVTGDRPKDFLDVMMTAL